jgi:hypothetical protein
VESEENLLADDADLIVELQVDIYTLNTSSSGNLSTKRGFQSFEMSSMKVFSVGTDICEYHDAPDDKFILAGDFITLLFNNPVGEFIEQYSSPNKSANLTALGGTLSILDVSLLFYMKIFQRKLLSFCR